MQARQVPFHTLMTGLVQYRIPLFQRSYTWNTREWGQLWSDLMEVYAMEPGERRNHFVGSVVTHPFPPIAGTVAKFAVIDGQQRLTTLMTLLAAVRDRAGRDTEKWGNLSDKIHQMYLTNEFASDPAERIKLSPGRADNSTFRAVIENGDRPKGSHLILRARGYFDNALNRGDARGNPINLSDLEICVANHLELVSVTLEHVDNPNKIFESLNFHGVQLDADDLIRNYLFMNIAPDQQDRAYNEHWYPMQETLGALTTSFFWHYLMLSGRFLPNRRDVVFPGVKDLVGASPTSESVLEKLRDFHRFSRHYAHVAGVSEDGLHPTTADRIKRLNQWGVTVADVFLMKALDHVQAGDVSVGDMNEVIRMIESFLVRRTICGVRSNQLRRLFTRMTAQVDFNNFAASSRDHLLNRGYWPSDNEFRNGFVRFHLYNQSRLARAGLILSSIERSFTDKERAEIDQNITIEHVMPQALSGEWRAALGADADEIHAELLHTIGNLTLTGYNSQLGNKPFAEKKAMLEKSKFSLNNWITKRDEWNAETIRRRASDLAERAVEIWSR